MLHSNIAYINNKEVKLGTHFVSNNPRKVLLEMEKLTLQNELDCADLHELLEDALTYNGPLNDKMLWLSAVKAFNVLTKCLALPYVYYGERFPSKYGLWLDRQGLETDIANGHLPQVNDLSFVPKGYKGYYVHVFNELWTLYEVTEFSSGFLNYHNDLWSCYPNTIK